MFSILWSEQIYIIILNRSFFLEYELCHFSEHCRIYVANCCYDQYLNAGRMGTRNWIFGYPESAKKLVEGKSNKALTHFSTVLWVHSRSQDFGYPFRPFRHYIVTTHTFQWGLMEKKMQLFCCDGFFIFSGLFTSFLPLLYIFYNASHYKNFKKLATWFKDAPLQKILQMLKLVKKCTLLFEISSLHDHYYSS